MNKKFLDFTNTLKGGVIMDVTNPEEAKIAESAGACAVMALERVPADIRREGGVARMSDPKMILEIKKLLKSLLWRSAESVTLLKQGFWKRLALTTSMNQVLSKADNDNHIDKYQFDVPFVCGARDLGEALRRIEEGASMIRSKGEAGTGDVVQAVSHLRQILGGISLLVSKREDELYTFAKEYRVSYDIVKYVHDNKRLPVLNFSAGGVATPQDAALMRRLGAEGVFVGSGIFKSEDPERRAKAIVKAVKNYEDNKIIAEAATGLGKAMFGINEDELAVHMADR